MSVTAAASGGDSDLTVGEVVDYLQKEADRQALINLARS